MQHSKVLLITSWALRVITAVILLQTLFFKFTGAVVELVASILILLPATVGWGAVLSLGVISGAIFSHLTRLGITLPAVGDRGELFALAILVFLCSAGVLVLHRRELPLIGNF
jgi:hypothetical protein